MSSQENKGKELTAEATRLLLNAVVEAGNEFEIDEPPLVMPPMVDELLGKPKP